MRFSSIFPWNASPPQPPRDAELAARAAQEEAQRPAVQRPAPVGVVPELPDELDVRVRLIGEWQLGEG